MYVHLCMYVHLYILARALYISHAVLLQQPAMFGQGWVQSFLLSWKGPRLPDAYSAWKRTYSRLPEMGAHIFY